MEISKKLFLIVCLTIAEISVTLWAAFEISKGATFHQLNFLHLKYNIAFSTLVDQAQQGAKINPPKLRAAILKVRDQPIACLSQVNALNKLIMKQIGTSEALDLCQKDIADADKALSALNLYSNGQTSKSQLLTVLSSTRDQFSSNSSRFEAPVAKTVNFILGTMIPMILIISLFNILFITYISRSISQSIRGFIKLLSSESVDMEQMDKFATGELGELLKVAKKRVQKDLLNLKTNTELRQLVDKQSATLQAIEQNAAHALIATENDGTVLTFNRAAEEMLGYKADELIGKQTPAVFHDLEEVVHRSQLFSESLGKTIEPGFETFVCHTNANLPNQFEWTYVHKNGQKFPVFLSITALLDSKKNKMGYLGIAQDISNLRKKEKELEESNLQLSIANEELTQFAYSTSHDLKAPLTSSKQLAKLIHLDMESGHLSEAKANILKIKKMMEKLEGLVMNILSLARAEYDEKVLSPINFESVIDSVAEKLSWMDKGGSFEIRKKLQVSSGIQGDETRLTRVLENLISNAIKYRDNNKENSYVNIEIRQTDKSLHLTLEDNGIGIPKEYQKDLFKMFKRFHVGVATGSGLGLSIVKKNIESMGGDIQVKSSDQGTRFDIEIPKEEG